MKTNKKTNLNSTVVQTSIRTIKFKNGDVVFLNSGGPRLTVVNNDVANFGYAMSADIITAYCDEDGEIHTNQPLSEQNFTLEESDN